MKVNNNLLHCEFCEIKTGECFVCNQELYLKISSNGMIENVFCISSNMLVHFSSKIIVQPVESEITVTNCKFVQPTYEYVEWNNIKKGTPILVGFGNDIWYKRFFEKYENGRVYACLENNADIMPWKNAKLID